MSAISSSTGTSSSAATTSTASSGANSPIYASGSGSTVGTVQSTVGPVSGINYQNLITELEASQQLQVTNIDNEIQTDQTKQEDYATLSANLSTLATSLQTLGTTSTFQTYQVQT